MDWLIELLSPGNTSLASAVMLYSFIIFAGIYLGKIKICGVSLGVTFVLFVGIPMSCTSSATSASFSSSSR